MLYEVNLKDDVWDKVNNCYVKLEQVLMMEKNDNNPLFLAVEQGAGKFKQDVNVVINPKTKMQSRKWLVEEYPQLIPQNAKEKKSSVIVKQFNQDEQYSNSLKEFLSPTFKNVPNNQQKKIGK